MWIENIWSADYAVPEMNVDRTAREKVEKELEFEWRDSRVK